MINLIDTISPALIRASSSFEDGRAVLTPVPEAWRPITPVVEEVLPKETPKPEEPEDPEDEEDEEELE